MTPPKNCACLIFDQSHVGCVTHDAVGDLGQDDRTVVQKYHGIISDHDLFYHMEKGELVTLC